MANFLITGVNRGSGQAGGEGRAQGDWYEWLALDIDVLICNADVFATIQAVLPSLRI